MNRLAILIPTIEGRDHLFIRLYNELSRQIKEANLNDVLILWERDKGEETTGAKRNILVQRAVAAGCIYCAFFDDDDWPSKNYIRHQIEVCNSGMDAGSLWGQIYFDCVPGLPFHHTIEYTDLFTMKGVKYCRPINHLNTCLTKFRAENPFPDQVFGEDSVQALAMVGKIKTEYKVDDVVYHYFCGKDKGSERELEIIKSLT